MSYGEKHLPRWFYIVGKGDRAMETLHKGYLDGVEGVSDTSEIIYHWLRVRNFVLKMPGKAFEQMNEMSRVMYDNPHYLVTDDMAALRRLYMSQRTENNDATYLFDKMQSYITKAATQLGHDDVQNALNWSGMMDIRKAYDEQRPEMKSFNDFFKFIDGARTDRLARVDSDELRQSFWEGLKLMGAQYVDEGEWFIKNKRISIPPNSILIVKKPHYVQRYNDFVEMKRKSWEMWDEDKKAKVSLDDWMGTTAPEVYFKQDYEIEGYNKELKLIDYVNSLTNVKVAWLDPDKYGVAQDKGLTRRLAKKGIT